MLSLRELGTPQPAGAALLCPWIDLSGRMLGPPMDSPTLFHPHMARAFADAYLAGHPTDDPIVDPLRADLAGLPPLLIHSASGDSVYQEAQLLAKHATECELTVTSTVFPVPTHDFHIFWSFQPEAATAIHQIGQFIDKVIQPCHQNRRTTHL
jgi:acetyl esterase/lipase